MNRLVLRATVVEQGALRYTPAAVPVIDLTLQHEGEVTEAGSPRKVAMSLKAKAVGDLSGQVQRLGLGTLANFAGFLASTRNGRGLVFHITAIDTSDVASPTV